MSGNEYQGFVFKFIICFIPITSERSLAHCLIVDYAIPVTSKISLNFSAAPLLLSPLIFIASIEDVVADVDEMTNHKTPAANVIGVL